MEIALKDVHLRLATGLAHGIGILAELSGETVVRAPAVEGRRKIGGSKRLYVVHRHTQAAIEGINHAHGASLYRHVVKLVGLVGGDEGGGVGQPAPVEQHLAVEDTACRKAHERNVRRVYAIVGGMSTHVTDGTLQVKGTLLHGVGNNAVVHHKALVAHRDKHVGHVVAFGLHAAEHEGTARTDDDRTLRRDGLVDGEHLHVGDKIGAVRIGCALRHSRDVAGPPQVDGALHRGRPVHRRFGHPHRHCRCRLRSARSTPR